MSRSSRPPPASSMWSPRTSTFEVSTLRGTHACSPAGSSMLHGGGMRGFPKPLNPKMELRQKHRPPTAALKNSVHPAKPRMEVHYVITELLRRLHAATDWVVRALERAPATDKKKNRNNNNNNRLRCCVALVAIGKVTAPSLLLGGAYPLALASDGTAALRGCIALVALARLQRHRCFHRRLRSSR